MLLLGIDVGTSSIKVSVVDSATAKTIASAQFPETEAPIISPQAGWAEQDPESWWTYAEKAILQLNASEKFNPADIAAIGIAYQMHGLVVVDKQNRSLRPSIIWCDSRAVETGNMAFEALGADFSLQHYLNSPGNFTAAKLAWVKKNEPDLYKQIDKMMLPGDFIAMKLTGTATTSPSALSEGILWDFKTNAVAGKLMDYFGFDESLIPAIQPVFSVHGTVSASVAAALGLRAGIPVSYKAGDQPNNALSLNVMKAGEVAATAGTSGVIYAVSDQANYDPLSRVNSFAHVNHTDNNTSIGILLCINGTGILNRWVRDIAGPNHSYAQINELAAIIPLGSEGLSILPFGNGAERMLENKVPGALMHNIQLNTHQAGHLFRAAQEGIACSFRYGFDILKQTGVNPSVIRAGKANMFLSPLFTQLFVGFTGVPVELYENDGAAGAAIGAGIGAGVFKNAAEAFANYQPVGFAEPAAKDKNLYEEVYGRWKMLLEKTLK